MANVTITSNVDVEKLVAEIKRLSEVVLSLERSLAGQIETYNKHIAGLHVKKFEPMT